MNFNNILLTISTVDCGDFNQGLRSDWLIAADFIKPIGPDKLKSELCHILRRGCVQKLFLVSTFPCINKNGYFIMETDTFGYIVVWTIYTSHTNHFTPLNTAFEHSAACLSVVFELLPGFIMFTILWHIGRILDKNVTMNKNYSYPATIWVSILTQIYVFLVLFTIFAFDLETFISKN